MAPRLVLFEGCSPGLESVADDHFLDSAPDAVACRFPGQDVTEYGHIVEEPKEAVKRARTAAGLSVRALAEIAGISPTTVTRIEAGRVDPGWRTLKKVLAAAGEEALLSTRRLPATPARSRSTTLAGLTDAWQRTARGDTPDWTRLRGTLDRLAQHPEMLPDALEPRPKLSGSAVMDTLLAGIAEKLADDACLPRPAWTKRIPRLNSEWSAPGTPAMLAARRAATPPQLKERGLVVDESSLWRDSASVDA
jgi:transcriptional regulator with XRE-family HTH domain